MTTHTNSVKTDHARNWIIEIVTKLHLNFIWMMDDDIKWFAEYLPENQCFSNNHLSFETVFAEIEKIMKKSIDQGIKLAAISSINHCGMYHKAAAFSYMPPHAVVYINLAEINANNVQYRPQLCIKEDMVFGAECMAQGLVVCRYNRIGAYSMYQWKGTGATAYKPPDHTVPLNSTPLRPSRPRKQTNNPKVDLTKRF